MGNWGSCSASCGGGTQTRLVECRSTIGYTVNDWQCTGTMPANSQSCNTQSCTTYSWVTGTWGSCVNNQQARSVTCKNNNGQTVSEYNCTGSKPSTTQSCNSWSYAWKTGNWGTCQNNVQDRTVLCERDDGVIVANTNCNS